jgi:cellulose synthase/poly-beta-1,6-N-acetylglucosamine synthase-like glycosyltransferase
MNLAAEIFMWSAYLVSLYFAVFWMLVLVDTRSKFKEEQDLRKRLKKTPIVSVLIPAYNEEDTIVPTLESVTSLDYPKDRLEVLVLNDGSTDSTLQRAREFAKKHSNVRVLTHSNRGKAGSLNRGLRVLKGEFFACLDADSFVERRTLRNMLSLYYAKHDRDIAIVTPAMKVHRPKKILQKLQSVEYIISIYFARLMATLDCIYVAPGPFSLYRTEIINRIGGFDEHNLTEDQEIAYKAQSHNYRIIHCYDGYVHTKAPGTVREFYKQRNRWYKGSILNVMKYRGLMMNPKYGDFGSIQMMKNLLLFLLCLVSLSFAFYYVVWPLLVDLRHLSMVGFDFMPYLMDFKLTFTPLSIDLHKGFVLSLMFLITFLFFMGSYRNANERVRKHGIVHLIPYFVVYYIMKSIISFLVIMELVVGKRQKW